MLNERRLRTWAYDAASDVARLEVGSAGVARKTADGRLLLDKQGFLVGVDTGSDALTRIVVMLGQHDEVESLVDARVVVTYDASGEVAQVEVPHARRAIRGAEKNPHV